MKTTELEELMKDIHLGGSIKSISNKQVSGPSSSKHDLADEFLSNEED